MVNVGSNDEASSIASPLPPPPLLYLPASNLTGPSLQPDGCIHNANAQQLRKHITLDCNQYSRRVFSVWVGSSGQGPRPRLDAFMMLIRAV